MEVAVVVCNLVDNSYVHLAVEQTLVVGRNHDVEAVWLCVEVDTPNILAVLVFGRLPADALMSHNKTVVETQDVGVVVVETQDKDSLNNHSKAAVYPNPLQVLREQDGNGSLQKNTTWLCKEICTEKLL